MSCSRLVGHSCSCCCCCKWLVSRVAVGGEERCEGSAGRLVYVVGLQMAFGHVGLKPPTDAAAHLDIAPLLMIGGAATKKWRSSRHISGAPVGK